MTHILQTTLLALFIGIVRCWIGRGSDGCPKFLRRSDGRSFPGFTYLQYAILIGGTILLCQSWQYGLAGSLIILFLARFTGHTPILYAPGLLPTTASLKGIEGWLWRSVDGGWWEFAFARYWFPAVLVGLPLNYGLHIDLFWVVIATVPMILTYRIAEMSSVDSALAKFPLGGRVAFSELIGWSFYGLAIGLSLPH